MHSWIALSERKPDLVAANENEGVQYSDYVQVVLDQADNRVCIAYWCRPLLSEEVIWKTACSEEITLSKGVTHWKPISPLPQRK